MKYLRLDIEEREKIYALGKPKENPSAKSPRSKTNLIQQYAESKKGVDPS